MNREIGRWAESDDGYLAVVFTNGSMALIRDPPPTEHAALEAATHFLPGREPFYIRRSERLQAVVYVYPIDMLNDLEPLTDDELTLLDEHHPRLDKRHG